MLRRLFPFTLAALSLSGCALLRRTDVIHTEQLPPFNQLVLQVAREYPTNGTHRYWWPQHGESNYDGCTRDMQLQGRTVMNGEPERRTYCCGFTLEVFLEAYNRWLAAHPEAPVQLTAADWPRFQHLWFVEDFNGPGPSAALEEFHMGREIERDEVLPGDFLNLWRTERDNGRISGHSVIFLGWVRDWRGRIWGMHYFSSQPGTNGIGEATERIGSNGGLSQRFTFYSRVALASPEAAAPAP